MIIKPDPIKSADLYNQAILYHYGRLGNDINLPKAINLYESAILLRNVDAMVKLAGIHSTLECSVTYYDIPKAIGLYQRASGIGNTKAMYRLAIIYLYNGNGYINRKQGLQLLDRAICLGNSHAMEELGSAYISGIHGTMDIPKGTELLNKAIALNNKLAMNRLAAIYMRPTQGFVEDKAKAVELYKRSSALGNVYATNCLAFYYLKGENTENFKEGIQLFEKSAEVNNRIALKHLARIYERGKYNTKIDVPKAIEYHKRASKLGDKDSTQCLVKIYTREGKCDTAALLLLECGRKKLLREYLFDHVANWNTCLHIYWPFEDPIAINRKILTLLLISKHRNEVHMDTKRIISKSFMVKGIFMIVIKYLCRFNSFPIVYQY